MESIVMLPFAVEDLAAAYATIQARVPNDKPKRKAIEGMALPFGVGKTPATRLMVFPLGEPPSNDARSWRFTAEDLAKVKTDFDARTEPVPILYEHGDGPRGDLAAGWIDSVDVAADGLYANVHWTDKARAEIRAGEWGFRSPAWQGDEYPDGALGAGPLDHLALVNNPAIGGMSPVTASVNPVTAPQGQEQVQMTNATVVVAKAKAAAGSFDGPGILAAIKAAFPGMFGPDFPDEGVSALVMEALASGVQDAPVDPMAPAASTPPAAPAVPAAVAAAEDVANVEAVATAPVVTDELKKSQERVAELEASIKTLQAAQLSGRIINANAADRTPATPKTFAERVRDARKFAGARS